MGQTATAKTSQEADQEIELICAIIRNGYHLGLNNHNRLSPRERFQFAVKLEEICAIAEWMSRYVEMRWGGTDNTAITFLPIPWF